MKKYFTKNEILENLKLSLIIILIEHRLLIECFKTNKFNLIISFLLVFVYININLFFLSLILHQNFKTLK